MTVEAKVPPELLAAWQKNLVRAAFNDEEWVRAQIAAFRTRRKGPPPPVQTGRLFGEAPLVVRALPPSTLDTHPAYPFRPSNR